MANSKKPMKAKRGRPKTDVDWRVINVRFTKAEKTDLEQITGKLKISQAELIREGAVRLLKQVQSTGKLELTIPA